MCILQCHEHYSYYTIRQRKIQQTRTREGWRGFLLVVVLLDGSLKVLFHFLPFLAFPFGGRLRPRDRNWPAKGSSSSDYILNKCWELPYLIIYQQCSLFCWDIEKDCANNIHKKHFFRLWQISLGKESSIIGFQKTTVRYIKNIMVIYVLYMFY